MPAQHSIGWICLLPARDIGHQQHKLKVSVRVIKRCQAYKPVQQIWQLYSVMQPLHLRELDQAHNQVL